MSSTPPHPGGTTRAAPALLLCLSVCLPPPALAASALLPDLGEVIVTSGFLPTPELEVPSSVAVLDSKTLKDAGQQQFEDVLALVPNLNWAGDTSRPRYFQIRGIGELEQYQGAPNPSVGFLIDDIDFSGLGGAATLFDVDHIEVLRGPQGTRYGANALAGLIYVESAAPAAVPGGYAELTVGDYGTRSAGAVLTGPVERLDSSVRLAVQHYYSDGFYHNAYLNRDDTNRRDELTLRGRWRFEPWPALRVDLSVLHVQLDNGYDAFDIHNNFTTQSDHPSVDAQHSTGASLHLSYTLAPRLSFTGIATWAESRIKYGFDGDWGNPRLWAPYLDDFTELQYRERNTASLELRLARTATETSAGWLLGLYGLSLRESLLDASLGVSDDPINGYYAQDQLTSSGYWAESAALYGVVDEPLAKRLKLSVGARLEKRSTGYHDLITNLGVPPATDHFGPNATLWGGDASLSYAPAPGRSLYVRLARGYKAGGFNLSQGLLPSQLSFAAETDLNLEAGYKADLAQRLTIDGDLFYLWRRDAQIKSSYQSNPNNPNAFVFYTGNAARGANYGLESRLAWQWLDTVSLGGSLGLLQTRFEDFSRVGVANVLTSRALADAPHWQAALDATYRDEHGRFARLDLTGMGSYYFDLPPNNTTSNGYALLNLKLGLERARWSVDLWGRNLTDKRYPVRGFFFGVVPPYYPNRLYIQLGDPRTVGLTLSARF